ncbi:RPB2 [Ecytonucleospora hepatopenaei]|uniref:DNA-directed RNA polymerase subunit beta n=1 Tax=Ecytonucleospora hepatopenaei TaxID=646526 RepID=A0A1W0E796_9MICR|nr:RPB2 [Ecytonucleospora hepatopenaei]
MGYSSHSEKNKENILGNEENNWAIITSFFEQKGLVRQQLDSFNQFVSTKIQEVIDENSIIAVRSVPTAGSTTQREIRLKFGQVSVVFPPVYTESDGTTKQIFPNEARIRDLTYSANVYIDISKIKLEDGNEIEESKVIRVPLGQLPIMVKSKFCVQNDLNEKDTINLGECPYDQGGYFIITGGEKVIIAQERMASNTVHVFKKSQPAPYTHYSEIRSVPEKGSRLPSPFSIKFLKNPRVIRASLNLVKQDMPVFIIFRALGFNSDKEIIQHVNLNDEDLSDYLMNSLEEASCIQDQTSALDFIGKRSAPIGSSKPKRIEFAKNILTKELFPHIGTFDFCETKKAYFLGYMINKTLAVVIGKRDVDDRDHYGKKRMDLSGPLLAGLFKVLFRKLIAETSKHLQRCVENNREFNLAVGLKSSIITQGFKYALATGNWGDQARAMQTRAGVAQVLNRYNFMSTLSHLRRVNTPIEKDGKLAAPRQLHNTHWGMICPTETPEGHACGLVKNLSLMAYISVGKNSTQVLELLEELGVERLEEISEIKGTKVLVNGAWIGVTEQPAETVQTLRELRRCGEIESEISIVFDIKEDEICITSDAGRPCRPLFIVKNNELLVTKEDVEDLKSIKKKWDDLIREGKIELLDVCEEEVSLIAMNLQDLNDADKKDVNYTHCEIHPAVILGITASVIPFPTHNPSPRNTYQSAMGKQAMGIYATNYFNRMDTLSNILYYPQKPLVSTRSMEYLKFKELPAGQNCIVAIACYSGYNQEDSIIMNQSAIDRGLFRSFLFRTYSDQEKMKYAGVNEQITKINRETVFRPKKDNYDLLGVDGLIHPGTQVTGDDVLIGKVSPVLDVEKSTVNNPFYLYKDNSTLVRKAEKGVVDKVILTTKEGYKFTKIKVRSVRIPQMGDKFASRHAQKGVVGITLRQEDMPFTKEGLIPDIIINPHAIPSRMTIGHLLECLLGKVSALSGVEGDATPFSGKKNVADDISNALKSYGYQKRGYEVMHTGATGHKLRSQIFIGPTYYQRLKHMVEDKIHARARGPLQVLTRQPVEGRSRDGGLRFGEMERDCIISHGASAFLKERLMDVSDGYVCGVCDTCGLLCNEVCMGCEASTVSKVEIPYAFKLLMQELQGMNIFTRIRTEE